MPQKSFSTVFTVDQNPQQAFDAILNIPGWWSDDLDGGTGKLGEVFTFRHQDLHRSTQKVTTLVPGKKVVWSVTDSHLSFLKDKGEWTGTELVFEVAPVGGKTQVRFTHVGLVPSLECYGDCSGGWTFYVEDSLKSLIATGAGKPERKS